MGLFDGVSKEEKQAQKVQEMMERFGLNNLSEADYKSCQKIINDLAGVGLMKAGIALSFGKAEDQCKIAYLSALVEQNWIVIRQYDEMNQRLDWIMRKMQEK